MAPIEALAGQIVSRTAATLILIGTDADRAAAKPMRSLPAGRAVDTTGQWALVELPVLLGALDCFVGVDSGATYMATRWAYRSSIYGPGRRRRPAADRSPGQW